MTFVNEYIPAEDKKKFNMIEGNFFYQTSTNSWTVDRERNMFLLPRTGPSPEGIPGQINWAFYWRGHLLDVLLLTIATGGDDSIGHLWSHKRVLRIDGLTAELEGQRSKIIEDLREALTANRGRGVLSECTSYELKLDVE
jgi:hypothetical protein